MTSLSPSSRSITVALSAAVLVIFSIVGCAPPAEEAPPEPPKGERVENAELGIAIAELPAFFQVASNEGDLIELRPADAQIEGVLQVRQTEAQTAGVNLVAAIERHKADLQGRADGEYKGQRELGSQLGTAFYSRGLFSEGGRVMEETVVFLVHPKGDRELHLAYVYPAGEDSKERLMDQLFGILGELEVVEAAAEASAPEDAAG